MFILSVFVAILVTFTAGVLCGGSFNEYGLSKRAHRQAETQRALNGQRRDLKNKEAAFKDERRRSRNRKNSV
jgi:hypothetical protein